MCPSHEGSLSLSEINSSKHSDMVKLFLTALTDSVSISLLFNIFLLLFLLHMCKFYTSILTSMMN